MTSGDRRARERRVRKDLVIVMILTASRAQRFHQGEEREQLVHLEVSRSNPPHPIGYGGYR
jgi:hypothetical protein